jgi:hypothetical protein
MRRLFILWLLWLPCVAIGQHGLGLQFLPQTYQSTLLNPALMQDAKVQVVQPLLGSTLGLEAHHSGFTVADVFVDPQADPLVIDPDQLIAALRPTNYLQTGFSLMPLAAAFQWQDKWQIGVHLAMHTRSELTYGQGLPSLLWRGNGAFLDQEVELGLGLDFTAYSEWGLSLSTQLSDKIRLGGRIKLLQGLYNLSTDPQAQQVSLYTDSEFYQVNLDYDYRLRAASALEMNIDSLNDLGNISLENVAPVDMLGFSNPGLALDLGLQLRPIDRLTLNASVVNLGRIAWRHSASVFETSGSLSFEGVDPFDEEAQSDTSGWEAPITNSLETFLDSASAALEWGEPAARQYRTALPTRFLLSGQFQLIDCLSLGAAWSGESYRRSFSQTVMLNASLQPAHWFTLGLNYAYDSRYRGMMGAQMRLNLKSMQVFLVAGNVLAPFQFDRLRSASLRMGMNLTFGRKAFQAKRAAKAK